MVAPVSVQDAQLGLVGIAAFGGEVFHHLHQVVLVHRQSHILAEDFEILALHFTETVKGRNRFDGGVLSVGEFPKILYPGFDGIDDVVADFFKNFFRRIFVDYQEF